MRRRKGIRQRAISAKAPHARAAKRAGTRLPVHLRCDVPLCGQKSRPVAGLVGSHTGMHSLRSALRVADLAADSFPLCAGHRLRHCAARASVFSRFLKEFVESLHYGSLNHSLRCRWVRRNRCHGRRRDHRPLLALFSPAMHSTRRPNPTLSSARFAGTKSVRFDCFTL
mgnify:CR=1 FL=1